MTKALKIILIGMVFILCSSSDLRPQEIVLPEESVIWQTEQTENSPSRATVAVAAALESLGEIENLVIKQFPGGAILEGSLLSPADMRKVVLLSNSMENILNLCTWHPNALEMAASYLQKTLSQNRIGGLHLSPLGGALLLTGTPVEEGDVVRVRRMCDALHIPLIDGTRSAVADPRMILFEVSFVEVNRDAFRELGIKWPASTLIYDPDGMRIGHLEPSSILEVSINHQVHEGNARIISKPRLVCASGQKASFQAGGEIPIPRSDAEGRVSVTWKPYGIILEVAPSIDSKDRIHVRIHTEVSMVDHANAVDGIPGIMTRRVDTFLGMETGQTVVLSGLVHSDDAHNIQKLPILGDIPILGELFRSRSFQKRETELVVFLTPLPAVENPHDEDKWRPTSQVEGPDMHAGSQ